MNKQIILTNDFSYDTEYLVEAALGILQYQEFYEVLTYQIEDESGLWKIALTPNW